MAIYYVWSAAAGSANGTTWANAYTTLTTALSGKVAGDTFYLAHDHAESTGALVTLLSAGTIAAPSKVVCVNRSGSVPPVSADRRTTAQITTTGAFGITVNGPATIYDGVIFNCGTGASVANLLIAQTTNHMVRFDNCSLRLLNTGASSIAVGTTSNSGAYVELNNTTVSFAAVTQTINAWGIWKWRNTASALIGAAVPSTLLTIGAARGGLIECIGVDLSAASTGKTLMSTGSTQAAAIRLIDCKLNASVSKTGAAAAGQADMDLVRASASGNYAVFRQRVGGTLDHETTIIRSGGASDGTVGISWKIITAATCSFSLPFECPPIAIWNDTTGSAKTATVECIASAIMTDQEIWVDLEYLGDASSPQGSFVNDGMADLLATAANQTSSSATWGGSTTAFKLAVTFTAQQKGWVYARVKVGKASSTVYIDPLITLT